MFEDWWHWWINFLISLIAATAGTAMRLVKLSLADNTEFPWRRLLWELPTITSVVFIAIPTASYLSTHYGIDPSVVYALCVVMGYLGTKLLDLVFALAEYWTHAQAGHKDSGKSD